MNNEYTIQITEEDAMCPSLWEIDSSPLRTVVIPATFSTDVHSYSYQDFCADCLDQVR